MNFMRLYPEDFVNGPGCRVTLFVSGCIHGCKGCYNKTSWNPKSGEPFTKEVEDHVIKLLKRPYIQGLSLSGGDPLFEGNLPKIAGLIERVRRECPGKDVWMWTGFELKNLPIDSVRGQVARMVDVLVDGKFEESLKSPKLKFRGSSNQLIIPIKEVLDANETT